MKFGLKRHNFLFILSYQFVFQKLMLISFAFYSKEYMILLRKRCLKNFMHNKKIIYLIKYNFSKDFKSSS